MEHGQNVPKRHGENAMDFGYDIEMGRCITRKDELGVPEELDVSVVGG